VLHKRESKSRPTQGIVTVPTRGINQDGAEVMSFAPCSFTAVATRPKKPPASKALSSGKTLEWMSLAFPSE
jgi:hypothetical protein